MKTKRRLALEIISLSTARGRLAAFGLATSAIFFSQYHWLANLSLYGHLGIDSPSIGLTRAYWLLIHGNPVAAWERNPLIFLVLAVGLPLIALDVMKVIKQRQRNKTA